MAGDIVGAYKDASSQYHGFLLSGGTYTTIDYPGAAGTQLNGLNDKGQIVGVTSSSPFVGFLYDLATQTFTTISYPRAAATTPFSINNAGTIAGYYTYGNRGQSGGFRDREPRQMYTITCDSCGNEAQVPFQPKGDRPTYCSDCYQSQRVGRSSERRSDW